MIFSPQRFLTLKVELADAAQSNGYHFRHQHPQLTYTIYQHHTRQTHRSPGKKNGKNFCRPKKKKIVKPNFFWLNRLIIEFDSLQIEL